MSHELREELFGIPRKLVMDPVHGGISFFEHEATIIDHHLFQRLRHIVQNDVTSLVFPGATHSRFQHSIGAMHVAGRLLRSVIRSYLSDPVRVTSSQISDEQIESIRYFYFCLRLAALLHDAGHFPFSHQIEVSELFQERLINTQLIRELFNSTNCKEYFAHQPGKLTHEHYSVICAQTILSDVQAASGLPVDPVDVLALMETRECKLTPAFVDHAKCAIFLLLRNPKDIGRVKPETAANTIKTFLRSITSGELDIDKMDYLLRDSFYSGCRYGIYNLDHLLSTIRIGFDFSSEPPWLGLAITEKGIGPLEDFIYSRFQLYQELYSHKTVVGFKWLIARALDEVLRNSDVAGYLDGALVRLDRFSDLTDTYFWEQFRIQSRNDPRSFSARLLRREKLRHLMRGVDIERFKIDELRAQIGRDLVVYKSPIKFSKIRKAFEDIRVLVDSSTGGPRKLKAINDCTDFFRKFENVEITHVYEAPESLDKRDEAKN